MQVMPTTADLVAKRLEIDPIEPEDLSSPDKNIQIGTAYLGNLLQQFNGNRVLALAAYNAGPTRAKRWRKNRLPIDAWIESIPFAETRAYVKNVLLYAAIYSQKSGLAEPLIYPYEVSQFAQPETLFSFSPPSADATAGNL
jgi:soluble lytic murein transglycosylase